MAPATNYHAKKNERQLTKYRTIVRRNIARKEKK
jgi:hypothetical protein